jgi:hypothetical protein
MGPDIKLLLDEQKTRVLANGKANVILRERGLNEGDFAPVVKSFCPRRGATWLLTELDPENEDTASVETEPDGRPKKKLHKAYLLVPMFHNIRRANSS